MINRFLETIVVPCAGLSTRLGAGHKWSADINGVPLLKHVLDPWISKCSRWIFVSSPNDERLPVFAKNAGIDFKIVVQPSPAGIADAVSRAAEHVDDSFTVLLGDCIFSGDFSASAPFSRGFGVWRGDHPVETADNFGVSIDGDRVLAVVEKPNDPSGLMCGTGIYFFDSALFRHLCNAVESSGGGAHITGILQSWIESGGELFPAMFDGVYLNVNTDEDIFRASGIRLKNN